MTMLSDEEPDQLELEDAISAIAKQRAALMGTTLATE